MAKARCVPDGQVAEEVNLPDRSVVRWNRRVRRYAVVWSDGYETVHEGTDLDLDTVIRWELSSFDEEDLRLSAFDRVVWLDSQALAVIRFEPGKPPRAIRIEPAPSAEGDDHA